MTKHYHPQPGTIPARVIAYLRTLPHGTLVPTAVIAEELGQPTSSIVPSLYPAVAHGVVIREKIDGRVHYSLGDGTPPESPIVETEPDPKWPDPKPAEVTLPRSPLGPFDGLGAAANESECFHGVTTTVGGEPSDPPAGDRANALQVLSFSATAAGLTGTLYGVACALTSTQAAPYWSDLSLLFLVLALVILQTDAVTKK